MVKRQLTTIVDDATLKRLEKVRDDTGISISRLIELELRGFKLVKIEE